MQALGLTKEYELANLLGFKKDTFAARKSRGALPVDKIKLLCADKLINFNWVMTGEGEMRETVKEELLPRAKHVLNWETVRPEMREELKRILYFPEIWERVQEVTRYSKPEDLSWIVTATAEEINSAENESIFPLAWVTEIADRYNVLLDWLLTGKGPMRRKSNDLAKEHGQIYSHVNIQNLTDPIELAFLNDWRELTEVGKMRIWTLLKEEKEREKAR